MLQRLALNENWKIRGFDGQHGQPEHYCGIDADERTFIDAVVPGSVHLDLERHGLIQDVNQGANVLRARWVEEQIWLYRMHFDAPENAVDQCAWLVFEGLDLYATVYLNGEKIGCHENAFTPLRINIKGRLKYGQNLITVSTEGGLYAVSERPGIAYQTAMDHRLHKRAWLRKPQCSFSWDWSPRLINAGIFKPVWLEWGESVRIGAVAVHTVVSDNHQEAQINANIFLESLSEGEIRAVVRMLLLETGTEYDQQVSLNPGQNCVSLSLTIDNPRLWWPRHHGDQPLYNLDINVSVDDVIVDKASRRIGVRSVRINQASHPETGNYFIIEVNGQPVFCKGGNWVPPDTIFARVTNDHYRSLVQMAVDANFNALRVWGGGLYADHALMDACDEMGVLVWHDFIFACSKYPADDPDYLENVREEIVFQVRNLSTHPSLVVWCGNNELEWGAWDWSYDKIKAYPDYALYHHEIPRIMRREDPSRPYWPSSPYSLDNVYPNDQTTGDQHPWHVTLQDDGPNFRAYRTNVSRFPNEGGVLGASGPATLRLFLSENELYLRSPGWELHDNACNYWGDGGICYRIFEHWLGIKADDVNFWDYCFYSALLQAEGLKEYADNFRRRMFSSSSAIFWMYNDIWPATHGWTIVDYYLRRKLAYHPVRRAFQPVSIIPAIEGDTLMIIGVNDTLKTWGGEARYGLFNFSGGFPMDKTHQVELQANGATILCMSPLSDWKKLGFDKTAAFGLLSKDGKPIAQNRLLNAMYSDFPLATNGVTIERDGDNAIFSSESFAWGVTLNWSGDRQISDDVFDILPGIPYRVTIPSGEPLPAIERIGSDLPWKRV